MPPPTLCADRLKKALGTVRNLVKETAKEGVDRLKGKRLWVLVRGLGRNPGDDRAVRLK